MRVLLVSLLCIRHGKIGGEQSVSRMKCDNMEPYMLVEEVKMHAAELQHK